MNCIVLISAPAGGKGTISKYIEENYNYDHISVGDLLREEANNNSSINEILKSGSLLDDNFVLNILKERLSKQNNNFIIDGFPRNINQAINFDKLLKELGIKLEMILYIKVDKNVALNRICNRLICNNCKSVFNLLKDKINRNKCPNCNNELEHRNDDKKNIFEKRYKIFEEELNEILNYYKDIKIIENNNEISETLSKVDVFMKGDK